MKMTGELLLFLLLSLADEDTLSWNAHRMQELVYFKPKDVVSLLEKKKPLLKFDRY